MKIENTVEIARPIEEVFAFTADVDNLPLWLTGVVDANKLTDGPLRKGSQLEHVLQFLGKRFTSRFEVAEYEDNQRMTFRTISGPIDMVATQQLEPTASGTRLTQITEGDPGAFFKVAEPVLERIIDRQVQSSLATLKDLVESAPAGGTV